MCAVEIAGLHLGEEGGEKTSYLYEVHGMSIAREISVFLIALTVSFSKSSISLRLN